MKKILAVMLFLTLSIIAQNADKLSFPMSMTDINGVKHDIIGTNTGLKFKGLEGKVVFLEFFGYECPPCLASIPHLIDLKKKYKDKLAVVAVEVWGLNNKQLKVFAKRKGINYIIGSSEKAQLLISYMQQRAKWKGSVPFFVAMDTKGNVKFFQAGMLPESFLEELFQELSDEQTSSKNDSNSTKEINATK